ncbi:MAG: nucleotide sugar dehydrogenase [Candidatus Altiarchaeota archaeon]
MIAAVIGLGRAGLPLAAVIADAGIDVIGYDIDPGKVEAVNSGVNPIPEEAGLEDILRRRGGKGLKATSDIIDAKDATVFVVIVPLFLDGKHRPDFSILRSAFKTVASVLKDGDLVVLETTVPPKTTETLLKRVLDRSGKKYMLAYSPERIMTGVSISRYREFPKVVGGIDEPSTEAAYGFYSRFCSKVVKVNDARSAELVKVAEGIYRDVNISLANELFRVCETLRVDFWQMRDAANHQYCSIHEPGMVGGHCIPVYPWFLMNDYEVPLIRLARKLNGRMAGYYADKALKIAGKKGKVGIVGLSYRTGVKEAMHTEAHALIKALKKRGLKVYGLDPMFTPEDVEKLFRVGYLHNPDEMDAVILANRLDAKGLKKERTVDVKNVFGL